MQDKQADRAENVPVQQYFGFSRMPFSDGLKDKDLFALPALVQVKGDVGFAVEGGMNYAIIGEIGSGKSTALHHACASLPGKSVDVINVVAATWGYTEFLRALLSVMGHDVHTFMPAMMAHSIRDEFLKRRDAGKKVVIAIDEASLLRKEVFAQIHTLAQCGDSSDPLASFIFCGQDELAELLGRRESAPLASRIMNGYFMQPLTRDVYQQYFLHHLAVAKARNDIFDQLAIDAIWTTSSRNLRKIGITCRRCLQETANRGEQKVTAAIVRDITKDWWSNASLVPMENGIS